ncbi:lipoprotein-releasing ABC transporter ATP-binding protein LolD [Candidatus Venteria ishoeyi]|uniref:Lipoprotein-releasing system ATP-binding protein LolD n=1 Tax=Candidatus Venteria ishoeyi TaxID=1899563 RepID=A0A1H6FDQ4_9GAMM|nr:lipoprotein-releasing ABC transporter ATP-binding protein LolD [Candidatus Venteria ishoeyi]MDM8544956.1 lipoprotein-releasing ABC transporter ATP-binding protein LolD [Candidatus Venteria ishoeyi]SEH07783.1 Lipoprotein-releasing system ATP-binding protein LolD [Candidatus Venteria ishoeyi]
MNELVLEAKNLKKTFHDADLSVDVLTNVDLKVGKGEQIAIVGSSGSGKSTLLHLLGGLDDPSAGEVLAGGKSLFDMNAAKRGIWRNKTLGFVYQFHHLLPEFTALENVAMPLLIRGLSVADAQEQAADMLDRVGLKQRLKHKPGELSGGERQRAAVARALVTKPQCLLADEPTGNLDQHTAQHVYETMLALNTEIQTSLVIVTHDIHLAQKMDRSFTLNNGQLEAIDTMVNDK